MTKWDPQDGKCKGSFAQVRRINAELFAASGQRLLIMRHPQCDCNTGCRRVTLWHPRPEGIEIGDDWLIKPLARIRWGDGCGGPEVEVDWKHGVVLDLSGCYDEVSLEFTEALGILPDEDNLLTFGVLSACCGAGAARGCATRTTARLTVESGLPATITVPIPPFAYAVQFIPVPGVSTTNFFSANTFVQQSGSGAAAPALITLVTGDTMPDPWALINGAESLVITQVSGAGIELEVVFLIGL